MYIYIYIYIYMYVCVYIYIYMYILLMSARVCRASSFAVCSCLNCQIIYHN